MFIVSYQTCVHLIVHVWCAVHLYFSKCIECMIGLFKQRATRGSWVCCRRSSWATTWWRQVSSDLLCPTYFIIHRPALHYWNLRIDESVFTSSLFTFWVIMVSFMLLLYFNQWTWCEYLWYEDVILMMILWYFRGLKLFPEYLSIRTRSGSDNPG